MTNMTMKVNKDYLRFGILLILMHNCFDLVTPTQKVLGVLSYYDFIFIYGIYYIYIYWKKYNENFLAGRFAKIILCVPILAIVSSLMAYVFYGQNILLGIFTQRAWIISSFLYFPLRALIKNKIITKDVFFYILYKVVLVEVSIYLIQYLLGPNYYFLKVRYTFRYESIRIVANMIYMDILLMHCIDQIMKKNHIIKNIFFIFIILLYVFIVNKGRGQAITTLMLILIVILFTKTKKIYKITICLICIIVSSITLLQSEAINEFTSIIFEGNSDATYSVRQNSQEFYLSTMENEPLSFLMGYGMQNTNISKSNIATGVSQGYLITDNGIYGFLFSYGIMGLIWYIYSLLLQLKLSLRILKNYNNSIVLGRLLMDIAFIATNCNFFYTYQSFSSILIMCLIEIFISNYNEEGDSNYECKS